MKNLKKKEGEILFAGLPIKRKRYRKTAGAAKFHSETAAPTYQIKTKM